MGPGVEPVYCWSRSATSASSLASCCAAVYAVDISTNDVAVTASSAVAVPMSDDCAGAGVAQARPAPAAPDWLNASDGVLGPPVASQSTRAWSMRPVRCAEAARSEEHTSELQSLRHLVC